jgi:large subunit ribosomal protein L7/L12
MSLNLLEIKDLTDLLKDRLNISDEQLMGGGGMMMPMAGAGAGAAAAEEEVVEEKTHFALKLTGFDASAKIKVIKEVRAITGLGLKEAKAAVEGAPTVLKESIKPEDAEPLIEALKAVGGETEME